MLLSSKARPGCRLCRRRRTGQDTFSTIIAAFRPTGSYYQFATNSQRETLTQARRAGDRNAIAETICGDEWLMSAGEWNDLHRELDLWAGEGLAARFWIRDDDASGRSAQLMQLHALAHRFDVAIGLAVIPGTIQQDLPDYLNGEAQNFRPMCHGWKHVNHGSKNLPSEFGSERPLAQLLEDATAAQKIFVRHFYKAPPIFVPPYNRISHSLTRRLPGIGFVAVSAIPSRLSKEFLRLRARLGWIPPLRLPSLSATPRIDVHIDLIDWRAKTAVGNEAVARALLQQLEARRKARRPSAPIGLLTHHLVHDSAIWRLCDELLEVLRAHGAVEFIDPADWARKNAGNGREGLTEPLTAS